MVKNTRKTDLLMFSELAGITEKFDNHEDIPFRIALPAFMTSELKTAFQKSTQKFVLQSKKYKKEQATQLIA